MENIFKSFRDTITGTGMSDMGIDIADKMLDDTFEDGLIKDIPILRTLYALYKATGNIGDYLLAKKIIYFINEINDVDPKKRLKMIQKIDESKEQAIRVGEKLIYILNRCDDHEKSVLIGKVFRAYLMEEISYDMFLRCVRVIDLAHVQDLKEIVNHNESVELGPDYQKFVSIGVVTIHDIETIKQVEPLPGVNTSQVGKLYPRINETGKNIRNILSNYFA